MRPPIVQRHITPEMGVELVVFGRATMERFHIQGMAQDKRQPFLRTQIGQNISAAEWRS